MCRRTPSQNRNAALAGDCARNRTRASASTPRERRHALAPKSRLAQVSERCRCLAASGRKTVFDARYDTRYNTSMIVSFRHTGLERFYREGRLNGIQPQHAKRLRALLGALDAATGPQDLDSLPGIHPLKGQRAGQLAVRVDRNWRLTFTITSDGEVSGLDYEDYH